MTKPSAPPPAVVRPEALPAWHRLGGLLVSLADDGVDVPCQLVPRPFVSESPAARLAAARWCADCPAVTACAEFAVDNGERFGVWGGVDRSPRPIHKTNRQETNQ